MTPDALKQYRVWTRQVNQTYYDVMASDVDQARQKAVREWRRENGYPEVIEIRLTEATHATD